MRSHSSALGGLHLLRKTAHSRQFPLYNPPVFSLATRQTATASAVLNQQLSHFQHRYPEKPPHLRRSDTPHRQSGSAISHRTTSADSVARLAASQQMQSAVIGKTKWHWDGILRGGCQPPPSLASCPTKEHNLLVAVLIHPGLVGQAPQHLFGFMGITGRGVFPVRLGGAGALQVKRDHSGMV